MSKETSAEAGIPDEYLLDLTKGPDKQDDAPGQQAGQQTQGTDDGIPDKFKGKSPKEIVEAYRSLETELGRARNEIGTVRRLADELLGIRVAAAKSPQPQAPERKPLTPDEILADPEKAVVSVVKAEADARDTAKEDRLMRLEYELNLARFERKHPDYQATMAKPEFQDWVQKSPLRLRLAQACVAGDLQAADELFGLFAEAPVQPEQQPQTQTDRARQASLTRPGGSTSAGVVNTTQGKPIWSRAKLMEMRMNNPEEFERLQPEILQAYAEKRVR